MHANQMVFDSRPFVSIRRLIREVRIFPNHEWTRTHTNKIDFIRDHWCLFAVPEKIFAKKRDLESN